MGDFRGMLRPLAAAALTLVLGGCATISDQLAGSEVDPAVSSTAASADSLLETVSWAELDGLVSVLVRNPTDRTLRRADAVVTLRDERGTALASTVTRPRKGGCCTVRSLRPGGTYGLYVGTVGPGAEVADVEVTYRDVSWSSAAIPEVGAEPVRIEEGPRGSVVLADVTAQDDDVPSAVVQAVITDRDGGLVAVVSGTWTCFAAGETRRIFMQLFRRVPEGSVVESVSVHPDTTAVAPECPAGS
ncbi:hypothetical protein [Nocardioides marmotae]|uniref:hypothetical protein n=1 Tax=Nocardioides marmotae TaxID=2663857 RepID=UPI0012B53268|nr:hypothetical protein [Nocardioides marmotae]MBC9735593.1 hypothetical protein [Nocardioides marmotae]MTB86689.1 hypothetical protein [Nocardioides marmotae]